MDLARHTEPHISLLGRRNDFSPCVRNREGQRCADGCEKDSRRGSRSEASCGENRAAVPGAGPVQISCGSVLSELSGRVEHFLNLSFAEEVQRPTATQPGVRVDEKDILHPLIVVGKGQQDPFQSRDGSVVRELPGRKHIPAFTKGEPDQLPERTPLVYCLRGDAQVFGDFFRFEDSSVLFDEAGLSVQAIEKGAGERIGLLNLLQYLCVSQQFT